jgi:hypothetical protein
MKLYPTTDVQRKYRLTHAGGDRYVAFAPDAFTATGKACVFWRVAPDKIVRVETECACGEFSMYAFCSRECAGKYGEVKS